MTAPYWSVSDREGEPEADLPPDLCDVCGGPVSARCRDHLPTLPWDPPDACVTSPDIDWSTLEDEPTPVTAPYPALAETWEEAIVRVVAKSVAYLRGRS